ncbi:MULTISPECIES: ferrochelatase [unclassified Leucobacter]|uniref:ferrochelatase n=1 Tax=unclassified Leucobacter TaxID=2621730 RepID=UPI00165D421B|nr:MULTISPECIES: ferrochelatase [unclassified Leucobacter]MBC9928280.1 ferrochelatase [Leucobacter sp. cx-169]
MSRAQFATEPAEYDALVLFGFGGPEGQDDVIPYLRNVTRGRGIPDERLEEVAHHYRHFGGISPINEQNRELRAALEAELRARGSDLPVLWGNRNWDPYFPDVLRTASENGHRRVLVLPTSAFASYSGCKQYQENIDSALAQLGHTIVADKVRPYFDHPGFLDPWISATRRAIDELCARTPGLDPQRDVRVLFATHSVPSSYSGEFGPDLAALDGRGAYEAQHLAASADIAEAACPGVTWDLVYQSRSGPPSQPWLEPDINDAIEELPAQGVKAVVIVPVGFVSDHMEVLWDLDTEALDTCARLGLAAIRVPTPGVDPTYVRGLIDLMFERRDGVPVADRPSRTTLGPWFDVCGEGCCDTPERMAQVQARDGRAVATAQPTEAHS